MGDKLELTWPGKHDGHAIVRDERTGAPRKVPYAEVQPRLLIERERCGDPDADNLLIGGENLYALKALLASGYTNSVKLVYIDPPFNTGNTFSHYDDGLELSLYLTMMRDRLAFLRELLADDGIIFVHLDANAVFHVRILMDELFGRDRFINDIIWKRSDSHKSSRKASVVHDTILVYSREADYFWRDVYLPYSERRLETAYRSQDEDGERFALADLMAPGDRAGTKADYEWNGIRPRKGRHWSYPIETMLELERHGRIVWNKNGVPKLKVYLKDAKGVPLPSVWTDIAMLKGGSETLSFDTQKPEALLQRILSIGTKPGDLVLDCYLGSGTTAAVAHKMGRRWIGIEAGEHAGSVCLPRLKNIVDGADQGGVSKLVPPHPSRAVGEKDLFGEQPVSLGWTGGGGFRFYTIGKALLEKDATVGVWRINYENGRLIEAVCLHEGFRLCDNGVRHGVKGRRYAHVTEEFVTRELVEALATELTENEMLTVYCLKAARGLRPPETVEVKRIPQALLRGAAR